MENVVSAIIVFFAVYGFLKLVIWIANEISQ